MLTQTLPYLLREILVEGEQLFFVLVFSETDMYGI